VPDLYAHAALEHAGRALQEEEHESDFLAAVLILRFGHRSWLTGCGTQQLSVNILQEIAKCRKRPT
jgi:hypothetical protein